METYFSIDLSIVYVLLSSIFIRLYGGVHNDNVHLDKSYLLVKYIVELLLFLFPEYRFQIKIVWKQFT